MKHYLTHTALAVLSMTLLMPATYTFAAENELEEIVVTARKRAETLQDVPVTITALTEEDLDRYYITNIVDAAKMVPNMSVSQGGTGNSTNLNLRGIGSSSISAAFDHSVAVNLDGVIVNRGRVIADSYLDMNQLEVLKGPQSLYFGKSATAGVVSITTKDPGDEFEMEISGGVETEYDGKFGEFIVSGPLTDTFGARLALGFNDSDERFENYAAGRDPRALDDDRFDGEDSLNGRLTLVWEPTDTFTAKMKVNYSEYNNDAGSGAWFEVVCAEGNTPQPNRTPAVGPPAAVVSSTNDCGIDGRTSSIDMLGAVTAGFGNGYDDGQQRSEQETSIISLQADWDFHENYSLTSVTGYVDLSQSYNHDASTGAGIYAGTNANEYESISQEFRLASDLDGAFNFQIGLYYQDIKQSLAQEQSLLQASLLPRFIADSLATRPPFVLGGPGAASYADFVNSQAAATGQAILFPVAGLGPFDPIGVDPFIGNGYGWNKIHSLDTEAFSAFFAVYWDITEDLELTFGARYSDEKKDGRIEIPYMHTAALLFPPVGLNIPSVLDDGLEFSDSNVSPEATLNYHINDDISVFVAYKEAFKSGGIDNSAFPGVAFGGPLDFLIYDSEKAKGWEIGTKANLLDGAMRLNATIFSYEYSDLQSQVFDGVLQNFSTFNASSIITEGAEFEMVWNTDIEGLTLRSAWAYTDANYEEDFITGDGENLIGLDVATNADWAGFVGFTYQLPVGSTWNVNFSADARYKDSHSISETLDPVMQDSYWITDAAVSLNSNDGKHQLNLIGRNLTDELIGLKSRVIPGRCANAVVAPGAAPICDATVGPNGFDQQVIVAQGRTLTLQYRFTY